MHFIFQRNVGVSADLDDLHKTLVVGKQVMGLDRA